jgi:hypothetical protein
MKSLWQRGSGDPVYAGSPRVQWLQRWFGGIKPPLHLFHLPARQVRLGSESGRAKEDAVSAGAISRIASLPE